MVGLGPSGLAWLAWPTVLHDLLSMPLYHHWLVTMDNLDTLKSPVAQAEGVPGEYLEANSLLTSQLLKVKPKNGFAGSPRRGGLMRGPSVYQVHRHMPTLTCTGPTCVHDSTSSCSSAQRAWPQCPKRTCCSLWGEAHQLSICVLIRPPWSFLLMKHIHSLYK